jgi:hypothetical protein
MTMLAVINQVKANYKASDPAGYAAMYGTDSAALAPSAPSTYVAPVAAATIAPAPTPVASAGGQIPIQVPVAPYSSGAVSAPAVAAASKPIDKKYLIIGAALLLVLFFFILRR